MILGRALSMQASLSLSISLSLCSPPTHASSLTAVPPVQFYFSFIKEKNELAYKFVNGEHEEDGQKFDAVAAVDQLIAKHSKRWENLKLPPSALGRLYLLKASILMHLEGVTDRMSTALRAAEWDRGRQGVHADRLQGAAPEAAGAGERPPRRGADGRPHVQVLIAPQAMQGAHRPQLQVRLRAYVGAVR